jgi:hypothetical protein
MSAPNSILATTDPVIDLRRKHQAFLARIGSNPPEREEIASFIGELQAAGRFLPDRPDDKRRGAVRNMLFYWTGDAIARGHRPKDAPLPQLADYAENAPAEAGAGAAPAAEESPAKAGEPVPPEPKLKVEGIAPNPEIALEPVLPDNLKDDRSSGNTAQSPGLGGLIGSILGGKPGQAGLSDALGGMFGTGAKSGGVLRKRDGKTTLVVPNDGPEPAHSQPESAAEKRPEDRPLTDIEAIARARIILRYAGSARQWKQTPPGKQTDYLLTGNRLAEASLYVNDDADIRAHVEASEKARDAAEEAEAAAREAAHALRNKQQKQRIAFLTGLVIFAFSMSGALLWQSTRLSTSLAETENQRRAAIEALAARDRADRERELAFESFDARQRQQTIAPPSASNISEAPRRPTPPSAMPEQVPVPVAVAEPCSGYLWLGSPSESRLQSGQSPATLKPGDKVTISLANDIRLRETAPSFNYQMGRQNGLVPAGGTVTISSLLSPYERSGVFQYWAQVLAPRQFCTSVFVQFAGAMPGKLDRIKGELLNIGVQAPPAEELASARGKAEVRYYWDSDRPVAQQLAEVLGKHSKDGKPLRLTPLTDFPPAAKAKATTIEVWLDLDLLKP